MGGSDISDQLQVAVNSFGTVNIQANGAAYHISKKINLPSLVHLTGNATLIYDGITDADFTGYDMFSISGVTRDISISGLTFKGLHVSGWTNAQMSVIKVTGDCQRLSITNCTFQDLVGFSVQQFGGAITTFRFNRLINCGNGPNINTDGTATEPTQLSDNYFNLSEGIESSGAYTWIERNTGDNMYACIASIGGDLSGRLLPGIRVRLNIVNGVSAGPNNAISVNDGCVGALVELNELNDCTGRGIVVSRDVPSPTVVQNTNILNNIIRRAGVVAIYTPAIAGITGTTKSGNVDENGNPV